MKSAKEAKNASLQEETMDEVKTRLAKFVDATIKCKKRGFTLIVALKNLEDTEDYLEEKEYFFEVKTETESFAVLRVWW